jgi:hypothetical protein
MHHESQDAHHGGTAVVQLDGALLELLLGGEVVPRKLVAMLDAVAKVAAELGLEDARWKKAESCTAGLLNRPSSSTADIVIKRNASARVSSF